MTATLPPAKPTAPVPPPPRDRVRHRAGSDRPGSHRLAAIALLAGALALGAIVGADPFVSRIVLGVLGMLVFASIAARNRLAAAMLVIAFLAMLGFIRRLLIPFIGYSPLDPLLLVSPAAAGVLIGVVFRRGIRYPRTVHSTCALVLLGFVVVQLFNPNEENIYIAAQAAMFYVTPLLWFFVGRTFDGKEHEKLLDALVWVSVPVVALGLYHTFIGFLPFELTWIGVSGQSTAIFLPGFRIRPFSTLASPQEYGFFLSSAVAVIYARVLYVKGRPLLLLGFFAVAMVALFFQASRSTFLLALLALSVMTVVRTRSPIGLIIMVATVAIAAIAVLEASVSAPTAEPESPAEEAVGKTEVLAEHQLSGLTNPGDSTASLHLQLIREAFADAWRNPLGAGVSRASIAAKKSDATENYGAESDLPNATAALGIPAGITFAILIITGLGAALRLELIRPDPRHLGWLGLLVACLNQWLTGNLYAVSTIVFLVLGGISREWAERHTIRRRADSTVGRAALRSRAVR